MLPASWTAIGKGSEDHDALPVPAVEMTWPRHSNMQSRVRQSLVGGATALVAGTGMLNVGRTGIDQGLLSGWQWHKIVYYYRLTSDNQVDQSSARTYSEASFMHRSPAMAPSSFVDRVQHTAAPTPAH